MREILIEVLIFRTSLLARSFGLTNPWLKIKYLGFTSSLIEKRESCGGGKGFVLFKNMNPPFEDYLGIADAWLEHIKAALRPFDVFEIS